MKHLLLTSALVTSLVVPSVPCLAQVTWSSAQLKERTLYRRAVEVAIWGMPAVNYDLMLQEMLAKTAGKGTK
jgi:hypothetical protein